MSLCRRLWCLTSPIPRYHRSLQTKTKPITRLAKMEDKDGILKIRSSPIYYGRDYLSSYLEFMLKHPRMKCSVVEINSEMVIFVCGYLVDGGNTVVIRGGRTREGYEGLDYIHRGIAFILESFEFKPSNVASTVTTMDDRLTVTQLGSHKGKWNISSFWFSGGDRIIREYLETQSCGTVKHVNNQRLKEIFSESQTSSALFPKGILLVDWVPYRCLVTNVDDIMEFRNNSTKAFETSCTETGACKTVSFGTNYDSVFGMTCKIEIYGDVARDIDQHVINHLKNTIHLTSKNVSVHILTCPETDTLSRDVMRRVPRVHQIKDFYNHIFSLEIPISKAQALLM